MKNFNALAIGYLFILMVTNVNAQVTIGLDEAPVQGALLQLKTEKDATPGGA